MTTARSHSPHLDLERQLRKLVRSARHLSEARAEADEQLRWIHALNTFALEAATTSEPEPILGLAGELLLTIFPFEQTLGLAVQDEALVPVMVRARPGCEGQSIEHLLGETPSLPAQRSLALDGPLVGLASELPEGTQPLTEIFEILYRDACEWSFAPGDAFFAILPLRSQHDRHLGFLLARATRPDRIGAHEHLPAERDAPFLSLVAAHLAQALENALLHMEVRQMAAELERRVEARTKELAEANEALDRNLRQLEETQAQLLHAGRMAAVGTLVAGVSHELSKPVMIIEGYAKALLDEPLGEEQARRALKAIERQAGRCANLIEGLLAFSRKPEVMRDRYPVEDLVSDVVALGSSHASERKVRIVTELHFSAVPEIEGVRADLQSALFNLLANAIDASPPGSEVRIDARPETRQARPGVCFAIRDQGSGIAESIREQIFDPFFTTKPVGEGVGLGLALTDRIAASHKGKVSLARTGAEGTEMHLWLPVV